MFDAWAGITILCPDIPKDFPAVLYGDPASMKSQFYKFTIAQCNRKTRRTCRGPSTILNYVSDLQVDSWIVQDQVNFAVDASKRPTSLIMDLQAAFVIGENQAITQQNVLYLDFHHIESQDNWIQLGQINREVDYNSVGKNINRPKMRSLNSTEIFNTQMVLSSTRINHERRIYGWLDLLGDMGGVQGALMVCFELFLLPISEHCFTLKVIKRLFLGNTSDAGLFKPLKKEKKKLAVSKDDKDAAVKENNRVIKLTLKDKVLLYIANLLGDCGCCFDKLWKKKKKL